MSNQTIQQDLARVEAALIDWKARVKKYEARKIPVPKHILDRIELLKEDARLLRGHQQGSEQ